MTRKGHPEEPSELRRLRFPSLRSGNDMCLMNQYRQLEVSAPGGADSWMRLRILGMNI